MRLRVAEKAVEMRKQGFFGPAMLPMGELEYTGIMEKLEALDKRFVVRMERTWSRRLARGLPLEFGHCR